MPQMLFMTDVIAVTVTLLFSQTVMLWHAVGLKVLSEICSESRFMNYGRAERWMHTDNMTNLKNARSVSYFVSAAAARLWHTATIVLFTLPPLNVGNKYESCCFDKTV